MDGRAGCRTACFGIVSGRFRHFARVSFLSDHRDAVPRLRVPSLILQCRDDAVAPLEVGQRMHARMPADTLVEMSATGHCPHVSAPFETIAAIRAFLD
jgi:sigma-B regulation protein RsbQ